MRAHPALFGLNLLEQDIGDLVANDRVDDDGDKDHRDEQFEDLAIVHQVLLRMEHTAVGGGCRGEEGNEHHHADRHTKDCRVNAGVLIGKGDDHRDEDNGHAGIISKVGGDQSKSQDQEDEDDVRLAA